MTDEDYLRFDRALTALLDQDGQERLVAFTLACAAFVLPLYEATAPRDDRLRRSLQRHPRDADLRRALMIKDEAFGLEDNGVYEAAAVVIVAIRVALSLQSGSVHTSNLMLQTLSCVQSAECAVARALESGSAHERLDLLGRMEGHTCLSAMLLAWLAEPAPLWQDRLSHRTGGAA